MGQNNVFKKMLLEIPKAELHLHLEGLATVKTIWSLIKKNKVNSDIIDSPETLKKYFNINSLSEFVHLYINIIQNSFKDEKDFSLLMNDALSYLKDNHIVYAEIFFSPTKFLLKGMKFKAMAEILDEGARRLAKESIEVKFILDVSRSFGAANAMSNLDLLIKNPADCFLGIGLGGSESMGPARDYTDIFKKARAHGLHTVAHAGEEVGPESIWETVDLLKPKRIGHGISAYLDDRLIEYLKENQIALEVCPTSNIFTKAYVSDIKKHPIKLFFERGIPVTINSDDPTLFYTSLINECDLLKKNKIFNPKDIVSLLKNNALCSFLPKKKKNKLLSSMQAVVDKAKYAAIL